MGRGCHLGKNFSALIRTEGCPNIHDQANVLGPHNMLSLLDFNETPKVTDAAWPIPPTI